MQIPRWLHFGDTALALLLAGAVGFLVWKGGEIGGRQEKHAAQLEEIERHLDRIDNLITIINRGEIPLAGKVKEMDTLLGSLNDKENQINGTQQAQIDELQRDIGRIDDRMNRIVQALDNTYNMLLNHLRGLSAQHEEKPPSARRQR